MREIFKNLFYICDDDDDDFLWILNTFSTSLLYSRIHEKLEN